jgi:hypothetical protein
MSDDTRPTAPTVHATRQEAYDLTLRLHLLPAQEISRGVERRFDQRPQKNPLPAATRRWLLEAEEHVFAWLSRDGSNLRAFVADPVAALQEAGVSLEREHLTAVTRLRRRIDRSQTVVPGLQLRSVGFTAGTADDTRRSDQTRDDRTGRG